MTKGDLIHYKLIITGRVQQVWFRKFTKEFADKLELGGTVRNLEDGSVEIFVSGNSNDVESLIKHCRKGPNLAHVAKVTLEEVPYQAYPSFQILK